MTLKPSCHFLFTHPFSALRCVSEVITLVSANVQKTKKLLQNTTYRTAVNGMSKSAIKSCCYIRFTHALLVWLTPMFFCLQFTVQTLNWIEKLQFKMQGNPECMYLIVSCFCIPHYFDAWLNRMWQQALHYFDAWLNRMWQQSF